MAWLPNAAHHLYIIHPGVFHGSKKMMGQGEFRDRNYPIWNQLNRLP